MTGSQLLAGAATAAHILAFVLYNRQLLKGTSSPNIISWVIWTIVTALNCTSYVALTGDWYKALLPTFGFLMCAVTLIMTFFVGRFATVNRSDIAALVVGLIAAVMWSVSAAAYANFIIQAGIAIGFVPTYRSVWKEPHNEPAGPWFVWTLAFVLGITVVFIRWQGQYADLVYYLNCLLLHGSVFVLSLRRPSNTARKQADDTLQPISVGPRR